MTENNKLRLFTVNASRELGEAIGNKLGITLSDHEERDFEDGEHKIRPLANVRGYDVYVVHSLYGDDKSSSNDKLCKLLFFIGALKDAAAARVTAVMPYLAYARKDRKTKSRDPVTTRYVAGLFEAVGTNCVITIDVHNLAAYQNAFRCQTEHLEARILFAEYFYNQLSSDDIVVVSPDAGGTKRAAALRDTLSERMGKPIEMGFMEKRRSAGVVSGDTLVGDVKSSSVIIIDDLISTGTTMARAAKACRDAGAVAVYAAATHGLFVNGAKEIFDDHIFDGLVVSNTVPPFRLTTEAARETLTVLDVAPLFAEAIVRMHQGGSLVDLMEKGL